MSIPMNPAEVPQASDDDLKIGFAFAVVMFGAHPAPGTIEAVIAEIARRDAERDLSFLCPQLSSDTIAVDEVAGNLG